ncbi:MAG: ion channel [Flammeovirgaceae bacterium]
MMYFTLTSLATVGYGDYHPSSVSERMIFSLIMLVGATFNTDRVLILNFF